ncbi:Nin1 binding protein [Imshaugia aleurites]|uniref:20S-pre-rRNA D-site endonuclease NOB1 n=1 Tax=Imshaugia aleurites TaxID=172621 RepID=A0A8H3FT74_9LECA|nr:Nin1 binding protein [Imshaugia aleurites]
MTVHKPVHTVVLDAGPLLKNEPTVSTLISQCENLLTIPSVIAEIRDENARSRIETTLLPFLTVRTPSEKSLRFVTDFSRKTGDLAVLSRTDLLCLALTHELECERNGGDWWPAPRSKGINASQRRKEHAASENASEAANQSSTMDIQPTVDSKGSQEANNPVPLEPAPSHHGCAPVGTPDSPTADEGKALSEGLGNLHFSGEDLQQCSVAVSGLGSQQPKPIERNSDSSDSEGWITPQNVKKHQAKDTNGSITPILEDQPIQVALLSGDFAMQNVCLQIGLNLLSPSLQRVRNVRTYVLRCHACFAKEKDMSKQFCSRCGKPTLTRVSCSTNSQGEFKLHLKKNMQWNHRGDRFSIPKPVSGSANGKAGQGKGGGKGGWGHELILAEDQKEYLRAVNGRSKKNETDLMDEDYLPNILTGDRGKAGGRPKIGAGRNVNSKKRI